MFHVATEEDVLQGRVTDVYFTRAVEILRGRGVDKRVRAEIVVKNLPAKYDWGILAGTDELLPFLERLNLEIDVRALPEGTRFRANQPVIELAGRYLDFCIYETAILGLICQASGVTTRAARCAAAAEGRPVFCFGARRVHPVIAPLVERYAYLAGCAGVAGVRSAEMLGIEPSGTMPHALILLLGDTVEATKAFADQFPQVKTISLIDTFNDEKFEAIRIAETLKERVAALRLDTPASRKGNLKAILREVRWELKLRSHGHIQLFVSGGLSEESIREFNEVADGYGVGTFVTSAPVLDFSLDIVEIDGKPVAKRGKTSGSKALFRCGGCQREEVVPLGQTPPPCSCGGEWQSLLGQVISKGKMTAAARERLENLAARRDYIRAQVSAASS
ncbi:MAG: nicotinate phosphoribosyltransferase [Acidobacteriota bacterium]